MHPGRPGGWRRRRRGRLRLRRLCGLLVLLGCLGVVLPALAGAAIDARLVREARALAGEASDGGAALREAAAYNERLAKGQGVVGEALDAQGRPVGDFSFAHDAAYQETLDVGGGVMGVLEIPAIDLELPIRHGAGDDELAQGVGHLHGTSLPVGGTSSHAVLVGHRGYGTATLFARLDELEVGDRLSVRLSGAVVSYEVDRILPDLPPERVSEVCRIEEGQDRLSLVTCTPLFVNTHRLVVSARRVPNAPDALEATAGSGESPLGPWRLRHVLASLALAPPGAWLARRLARVWGTLRRRAGRRARSRGRSLSRPVCCRATGGPSPRRPGAGVSGRAS